MNYEDKSAEYILNYANSLRLDKKVIKRPKKLQCRPGFEQRGAACQKIRPRKSNLLVKVAAGAVVAGVAGAAVAKGMKAKTADKPVTPEAIQEIVKNPKHRPYLKAAAIAGVSTATVAGAIAIAHPQVREELIDRGGLNNNLYKKAAEGAIDLNDLTEAQKRGNRTLRKVMETAAPKTSPSGEYTVDTDMDNLAVDVKAQYKKNQAEISKLPKGDKKRVKLENQQSLMYSFLFMQKHQKQFTPNITVMGFRDKEGNLVGFNAAAPSPQHEALEFSGFVVFNGAPTTAAKDIMATNKEYSRKLGMKGRMVGQPFEEAKPIYKRYGAKPIPGTKNDWLFEGDDRKDSLLLPRFLIKGNYYATNLR